MAEKEEPFVYIVRKPWGSRKEGQILPESREVRRKLREGDCLEKITKSDHIKEVKEASDKMAQESKNKMQKDTASNKGGQ